MLTNQQADETYESALEALHSITIDPAATPEQKSLAREQRTALSLRFIGAAIASVEERTAKFQSFIDEMNGLIAEFGSNSLLEGVRTLKTVVDSAGELIGVAMPARPAVKSSTAKPAARVAPKAAMKKPVAVARKRATPTAKKPGKATKPAGKVAKSGRKAVRRAR